MKLGVCYYPEHWPRERWSDDARLMRESGIELVRIGEFAWSRLEPQRGEFRFDWLACALDTLHAENLKVVLGTPTATPPKWLVDEYPEILAIDAQGAARGFGSRRHYCFSSRQYREECARIVKLLGSQFGRHPAIHAWQTDNEYGCHDTIESYSRDATLAFRVWCQQHYPDIHALNTAWGNVFWSMEYHSFDAIDLPCGAVTELNPAHRLAFWHFCTAQVKSFNKLQVDILREHSPGRDILHNYMGNFIAFDHHAVADDLDIATWDNYPLGFLERDGNNQQEREKWYRTGHPDSSAFHHDLYRGLGGNERFWVIEQQPGPVNWAPHNPSPLDGMVRLWGWEAFAHGAEAMCWFRWRQLPVAQEQMHSGLLLPNGKPDTALQEVQQLFSELQQLDLGEQKYHADVALVFDYTGDQVQRIQVQGQSYDPLRWTQQFYSACRQNGVNIDIVSPDAALHSYRLVILANSAVISEELANTLQQFVKDPKHHLLIGPRCGSKTRDFAIPANLPPGPLAALLDISVDRAESLPEFVKMSLTTAEGNYTACTWRERIRSSLSPTAHFDDGWAFHFSEDRIHYLNCCLDNDSLNRFVKNRLQQAGIGTTECLNGLRIRCIGDFTVAVNYGPEPVTLDSGTQLVLGSFEMKAADVAVWRVR